MNAAPTPAYATDTLCHCGKPEYVHADLDGFTRGLCQRCDEVRCDIAPGACVTVDLYAVAKDDPVARIILEALHQQDASTYNGLSSDIGRLALDAADRVRQVVAALRGDSPTAQSAPSGQAT